MTDKGIPPPDFNQRRAFNPSEMESFDEEASAFRDLMDTQKKGEARVQKEAENQEEQNKAQERKMARKEALKEDIDIEEAEQGVEEEDLEKTSKDKEAKDLEESRSSALKKGKRKTSSAFEDEQKIDKQEELSDLAGKSKKGKQDTKLLDKKSLVDKDSLLSEKSEKNVKQKQIEEEKLLLQKHNATKKKPKEESKKTKTSQNAQSIAANVALTSTQANNQITSHSISTTQGMDESKRKDLEKIVEHILEEAESIKKGDEIRTTIQLDLPSSIFNQGKITISAYKYRPLEVNLKFENFSAEGTKLIKQNQSALKNNLKNKSLSVHQLDVIE